MKEINHLSLLACIDIIARHTERGLFPFRSSNQPKDWEKSEKAVFGKNIVRFGEILRQLGLDDLSVRVSSLGVRFQHNLDEAYNFTVFQFNHGLHVDIVVGLASIKLALVEKVNFFQKSDLFCERVNKAFPSAVNDIKLAGNCLSLGLHTAAVFHCMRALEYALRAFARHLKIKLRKPIDQLTWGEILHALGDKLKSLRSLNTKRQIEVKEYYDEVRLELMGVKDVWRNKVMHANVDYDEEQALKIFSRTKDIMQKLAERVSE